MQPIVCRLDQRCWFLVVAVCAMALAFIVGPSLDANAPQDHVFPILSALFGLLLLPGVAYMVADLVRGQVRADDDGLQWRRGFSKTKRARWDEIEDFYKTAGHPALHYIETPHGKIELSTYFTGVAALLELVPRRAATSKASDWEVRGFRRGETWELALPMWSKSQKWSAPIISGALTLCVVLIVIVTLTGRSGAETGRAISGYGVLPLILGALFFGSIAAAYVWLGLGMWRDRRYAWEHRAQVLLLNAQGLIFQDENRLVRANWDEIERVERVRGPHHLSGYRVITRGGEFDLWRLSSDQNMAFKFRARCEHYAPAALEPLRAAEADLLLDAELDPAPPIEGETRFSFRTRGNRLVLLCVNSALFFAPFLYLISVYNAAVDEPVAPAWLLFGALCFLAVLISGALGLWFARAFIVAAKDLELHAPFLRTRHVVWDEIETVDADIWGHYVRVNGRKIYWMRWLAPARRADLEKIIEIHWLLQT